MPDQFVIRDILDYGRKLQVERVSDGAIFVRHPDDVKKFSMPVTATDEKNAVEPNPWENLEMYDDPSNPTFDLIYQPAHHNIPPPQQVIVPPPVEQPQAPDPRRPTRNRNPPDRLGIQQYDENIPLRGENDRIAPWWPGFPRNYN